MTALATPTPTSVLHVVHGLGSGVEMVVLDYVRATPELEHHVLFSVDPACHDAAWTHAVGFASTTEAPPDVRGFLQALRQALRSTSPDLVHAHSSIAGALARVAPHRVPVVYTPHCFAFVRRDRSSAWRALCWLVEAALATRTAVLAGCSPHEVGLARRFTPRRRVRYVPNIAAVSNPAPGDRHPGRGRFTVVAAGRISAQKDPGSFVAAASAAARSGLRADFVWIGSGSAQDTARLERAGVRVTGWIPRADAMARLAASDLYVHTALWEAAPLTILEAAQLGVPVLARGTAPIRALGLTETWQTTRELVARITELARTQDFARLQPANERLRAVHHRAGQQAALRGCYRAALRRAHTGRPAPRTAGRVGPA